MILPQEITGFPKMKVVPDNMCTIEHFYSRLNSRRGKVRGETTTICCTKCNNQRSFDEHLKLTKEELNQLGKGIKIRKDFSAASGVAFSKI